MSIVLKINHLTKKYGRITAVKELDLEIHQGQVYGILGPNGSGKSTTIGLILDVVAPSSGHFEWFGGMKNVVARQQIGTILETPCFYHYLSATQNLKIVAHIKKCGTSNIPSILKTVGLFERRNDNFKTYSLGMKQRLSIAASLLANPPVLIFDEPTNGLDPEGIVAIRQLIIEIASKGKTIIIASHLLDEVQKICTHFCVLKEGKKLYDGGVKDILESTNVVEISVNDSKELQIILRHFEGAKKINELDKSIFVELKENFSSSDLNKFCFDHNITLKKIIPKSKSLEQEFLNILKEND